MAVENPKLTREHDDNEPLGREAQERAGMADAHLREANAAGALDTDLRIAGGDLPFKPPEEKTSEELRAEQDLRDRLSNPSTWQK